MIDYLRFAQVTHGIETTALALGNVFGPRQDPHGEAGVISIFLQQYLSGNRTTIFGSGLQTRDFIYVGDVVQAFARAAEQTGEGLLLNIGTGIETSVNDLIQLMNAVTKKTIVPKYEPARLGELDRSVLDSRRAKEWMNWSSSVDVRSGLEATWEWIRHGAT
jgi:UDP-glucose 4-epimerase